MINKKMVAAGFSLREKRHRLSLDCYRGQRRITFTLCIEDKTPLFMEKVVVDRFIKNLTEAKNKHNCRNWVYVFMPDHLHVVNEGVSGVSDLWKMMNYFKQKTGFWLAQNKKGIGWQKDFYDHIHRKEENLKKHIIYILNNPVRQNLVSRWQDYPFAGSLDFSLDEIIS